MTITLRQPDVRLVEQRSDYTNGLGLLVAGLERGYGKEARRLPEYIPAK